MAIHVEPNFKFIVKLNMIKSGILRYFVDSYIQNLTLEIVIHGIPWSKKKTLLEKLNSLDEISFNLKKII